MLTVTANKYFVSVRTWKCRPRMCVQAELEVRRKGKAVEVGCFHTWLLSGVTWDTFWVYVSVHDRLVSDQINDRLQLPTTLRQISGSAYSHRSNMQYNYMIINIQGGFEPYYTSTIGTNADCHDDTLNSCSVESCLLVYIISDHNMWTVTVWTSGFSSRLVH